MPDHSPLHALVYISRSALGLTNAELEDILAASSARNRSLDVTGALLFDGLAFLQYIEGPQPAIATVFARVEASRRHSDIRVLARGQVDARYFTRWSMACRHVDASMIQRLEASRWTDRAHPRLLAGSEANSGLGLLHAFWVQDPPVYG